MKVLTMIDLQGFVCVCVFVTITSTFFEGYSHQNNNLLFGISLKVSQIAVHVRLVCKKKKSGIFSGLNPQF